MLNVFQIAPNDQSLYFLGQIFGNVGFALAGAGPALLGSMFKIFNTALLSIAALIVTYTTVVGVLKTAGEGKFLGEKWNSLWTPVRMVMGIVALMPTKAGYCVIQVIFMWFIVQGIGAADMVWTRAVDYLSAGGPIQTPSVDYISGKTGDPTSRIPALVKNIYSALVCQAAAYKQDRRDADAMAHAVHNGNTYSFGYTPVIPATSSSKPVPSTAALCGQLVIPPDDNQYSQGRQDALTQAMGTLVPVLEVLANYTVNQFIKDATCWTPCTGSPNCLFGKYSVVNVEDGDLVNQACLMTTANAASTGWSDVKSYSGSNFMRDAATLMAGYAYNYASQNSMKRNKDSLTDIYKGAANNGWIYAGAYYYYIALQNNSVSSDFSNFIDVVKNASSFPGSDKISQDFAKYAQIAAASIADSATKEVEDNNQGQVRVETGSGSSGPEGAMTGVASSTTANLIQEWTRKIAPGAGNTQNPLVTMQQFGTSLLKAAESLFWILLAVNIVMGALSSYYIYIGTTITGALPGVMTSIIQFLLNPMWYLVVGMAALGATLGIYVPLLPYILFTLGAIGWLIVSIEAMVAAPIVALAILSPGGEHEILGRAQPVPMIILNIILRPTLMVFGMMAGMLLSYVVIYFINGAFYNVLLVMAGNYAIGLLQAFFYLAAYTGLVIAALNKCFSLIHHVPDKVLRYMGHHGEAGGEEQAAQEIKGKVGAAGGEAGKVSAGAEQVGGAERKSGTEKSQKEAQEAHGAAPGLSAETKAANAKTNAKGGGGAGAGGDA